MNVANSITLSRLCVTVAVFVCLEVMRDAHSPDPVLSWLAFALFLFAAVTDAADGYVARHYDQVTRLGRMIDPFADKILICGTLVCCLRFPAATAEPWLLQTWMVVVILCRELLVTTVRGVAEASGLAFPADKWGKLKMVAQCTAVAGLLTMIAGTQIFYWITVPALWLTLLLTVVSGVEYMARARPVILKE
ncbi:MAG: CDP-diacylglycerol--glycerol-3-phosphate 3-phosphatidyltransferase [Planctomycetota bacterium]